GRQGPLCAAAGGDASGAARVVEATPASAAVVSRGRARLEGASIRAHRALRGADVDRLDPALHALRGDRLRRAAEDDAAHAAAFVCDASAGGRRVAATDRRLSRPQLAGYHRHLYTPDGGERGEGPRDDRGV